MNACSLWFRLLRGLAGVSLVGSFLSLPASHVAASGHAGVVPVTSTIQAAIDLANDGDTVSIPSGTYTESLNITKNLTLAGQADLSVVIKVTTSQRVITVTSGKNLTLRDLIITGGSGVSEGGGVRVENATLTVEHCNLYSNQANYGGAIYQKGSGQVIIQQQSYIYSNQATYDGGGIYANGTLSISSSWMDADKAERHGGAASAESLTIVGGAYSFNQAGQNGGAFNVNDDVSIDQAVLMGNVAGTNGGAILQWNGDHSVSIQGTHFQQNSAVLTGGALSIYHGSATTISQSQFKQNYLDATTVDPKGGAVYFSDPSWGHDISIDQTTFEENSIDCSGCSWPSGGAVYAATFSTGKAIIQDDLFLDNQGWLGAGLHARAATIERTTFQGNTGGSGGGGYLIGDSQIVETSFFQNSVVNNGGALVVDLTATTLSIEDSRFTGNAGGFDFGGAMDILAVNVTMKNVAVADTSVVNGAAILFPNPLSHIDLFHLTVNDTHLSNGARTDTYGIHLQGPTIVNIWNSMITNHGTGVKIEAGSGCNFYQTLWFGNGQNVAGDPLTWADYYPVFGDPAYAVDRYHITSASGAIDQGADRMVYHDIDGEARDSHPDIGADEFRVNIYLPGIRR